MPRFKAGRPCRSRQIRSLDVVQSSTLSTEPLPEVFGKTNSWTNSLAVEPDPSSGTWARLDLTAAVTTPSNTNPGQDYYPTLSARKLGLLNTVDDLNKHARASGGTSMQSDSRDNRTSNSDDPSSFMVPHTETTYRNKTACERCRTRRLRCSLELPCQR